MPPPKKRRVRTCKLCGATGATAATCPFNPSAKHPNPSKHRIPPQTQRQVQLQPQPQPQARHPLGWFTTMFAPKPKPKPKTRKKYLSEKQVFSYLRRYYLAHTTQ